LHFQGFKCVLKSVLTGRQKGRKHEEENIISYKMTIRKMEYAGI